MTLAVAVPSTESVTAVAVAPDGIIVVLTVSLGVTFRTVSVSIARTAVAVSNGTDNKSQVPCVFAIAQGARVGDPVTGKKRFSAENVIPGEDERDTVL